MNRWPSIVLGRRRSRLPFDQPFSPLPWSAAICAAKGRHVQRSDAAEIARDAPGWARRWTRPAARCGSSRWVATLSRRKLPRRPDAAAAVDAQMRALGRRRSRPSPTRATDARWIFHIGHVGSTLVSRLLGELDGVLAIREPRLLRDLALIRRGRQRATIVAGFRKLMSRTFGDDRSRLREGDQLRQRDRARTGSRGERGAVHVRDARRTYIASILAGENSVRSCSAAGLRSRAERDRGACQHWRRRKSDAQLAAVAWACEMTSLEAAAGARWPIGRSNGLTSIGCCGHAGAISAAAARISASATDATDRQRSRRDR